MEKYGIETTDPHKKDNTKEGEEKCTHPEKYLKKENGTVFCTKCGKYLGVVKNET